LRGEADGTPSPLTSDNEHSMFIDNEIDVEIWTNRLYIKSGGEF